jgi:hypothetical protein
MTSRSKQLKKKLPQLARVLARNSILRINLRILQVWARERTRPVLPDWIVCARLSAQNRADVQSEW